MGSCLSTKKESSSSSPSSNSSVAAVTVTVFANSPTATVDLKKSDNTQKVLLKKKEVEEDKGEEGILKKEVFVIKHRKSHDKHAVPSEEAAAVVNVAEIEKEEIVNNVSNGVVRTSSCTKEEVDAILIQCGRLSRSNSSGKTASSAIKYSGSKRSYDFDHDVERDRDDTSDIKKKSSDEDDQQNQRQHRQRHRQSNGQSPAGRRRTPSRETDQQRSGSRERGDSSSSGRRLSRSPGRRSENSAVNATSNTANGNTNRPRKMVSVPATVTSLVMNKSNDNGATEPVTAATTTAVETISVKKNVGERAGVAGSRTAASPRSQSPARTNANNGKISNENQQQPSLSRSSSRKAEHSPYRRNPLSEIDPNALAYPQSACNNKASNENNNTVHNKATETEEAVIVKESSANVLYQPPIQKPNTEIVPQGTNYETSSRSTLSSKVTVTNIMEKEHQQILEEAKTRLTRSRSSRRSRDLDLNPETLLNPSPSYTVLLLEDIKSFHQKSTPSVSLPACVTNAYSTLEAVADLNSTTSSSLYDTFPEDNKNAYNFSAGIGKTMTEAKAPFATSEVFASDDLTEPSFHKYITVRRGGSALGGVDLDEQESSGSNSFLGSSGQQNWNSPSSSWEPNSANSTDRWTSRSNTKEENQSPLGFQRHALSEAGDDAATKNNRYGFSKKMRETDYQKGGNWRGRVAVVAAAAST